MKAQPASQNFFTRLGVNQDFVQDDESLRQAYFKLQQQYHPDRAGQDAKKKAEYALLAANINEAYNQLKDPLLRAKHLLHLNGVEVNSENDTQKPSQHLLLEVMEWRERAEEGDTAALHAEFSALEKKIQDEMAVACGQTAWHMAAEHAMRWHYLRKTINDIRK